MMNKVAFVMIMAYYMDLVGKILNVMIRCAYIATNLCRNHLLKLSINFNTYVGQITHAHPRPPPSLTWLSQRRKFKATSTMDPSLSTAGK